MNRLFLPMSFASFSLALLFTACSQPAGQQGGSEYKLITVEKTDQTLTSSYTAVINGRQSVEIRPQVSGTITDICVNEGAKVTKGQTLFIIDQVPYQSALQTALANVKSAEAYLKARRLCRCHTLSRILLLRIRQSKRDSGKSVSAGGRRS